MINKIEKILTDKHNSSGGRCGTYVPSITEQLRTEYKDVSEPLNKLFKEKKISIRPGSQGRLLFIKLPKTKNDHTKANGE